MSQTVRFPLRVDGNCDCVLLASCLGDDDTGGGLFAFDGDSLETVDRVSTTGLFVDNGRLFRALWSAGRGAMGEVLVYDHTGVELYCRVDQLADPHDLIWDGSHFVAVSSLHNCVYWISRGGEVTRIWRAPGEEDSWHLNSLLVEKGRLLACAFGRYSTHREWVERVQAGDGIVFDVESGRDVLTGLCAPHHPRHSDEEWIVCNSVQNSVLRIEEMTGRIVGTLQLKGWTRGVAISDDFLFVGESANRHGPSAEETARIAVVSKRNWEILDRVPLPCREVYDLVLAPTALAEGVRRGFRTNRLRTAEQDQLWMFQQIGARPRRLWATGDPLSKEDCKARVEAAIPATFRATEPTTLECTITNLGASFFVSAPPNPVHLSYKWVALPSSPPLKHEEGMRTPLPRALPPRESIGCRMQVQPPDVKGEFLLRITLVQEHVAWFDDVDETNSCSGVVRVE